MANTITVLTVHELRGRLSDLPAEAELYVYLGPDGVVVQSETMSGTPAVIMRSPSTVPTVGGPLV